MIVLPFKSFASFTEEIQLDNVPYRFTFNWNYRGQYYSLVIRNVENTLLIAGIKLLLGKEHFELHPDRGLPPGQLFVVDTSDSKTQYAPIGRNDLTNGRLILIYISEDEL